MIVRVSCWLSSVILIATLLRIAALLLVSSAVAAQGQDWLTHVRGLGFGERLSEIKSVSQLPEAKQRERVPALIQLLMDDDQSVRITAAAEIAQIRGVAEDALPSLIENFRQPDGEEGMEYVLAVAAFGEKALPRLERALGSSAWLVRTRACDATRKIRPQLYRDGECKEKAS